VRKRGNLYHRLKLEIEILTVAAGSTGAPQNNKKKREEKQ